MRHRSTLKLLSLVIPALATSVGLPAASPQAVAEEHAQEPRAEILILGTYHMANPGRDIYNTDAGDVLSAQRQAEIEEVIRVLEDFRPTKIALEANFSSADTIDQRYAAYLNGETALTRNERQQLGFRLARKLGHDKIYSVDVDGEFPYMRLVNYVKAANLQAEFDALGDETRERVDAFSAYLASHTILEALLRMNTDEQVTQAMAWYYRVAEFGEDWDWPGADLVADWTRRNMRIYTNIARLADSPEERVLVIYGAGHLGWLRHAVGNNPRLRLRRLSELVGSAKVAGRTR